MNFNYSVIGTHPEVDHLRDELPNLIAEYKNNPQIDFARVREIAALAEHFYGLTLENADDDLFVLIDQIHAADQYFQFS